VPTEVLLVQERMGAKVRRVRRAGFEQVFQATAQMVLVWQERAQMRQALQHLDDRMLRDIGLSRAEAEREANKPFWHK